MIHRILNNSFLFIILSIYNYGILHNLAAYRTGNEGRWDLHVIGIIVVVLDLVSLVISISIVIIRHFFFLFFFEILWVVGCHEVGIIRVTLVLAIVLSRIILLRINPITRRHLFLTSFLNLIIHLSFIFLGYFLLRWLLTLIPKVRTYGINCRGRHRPSNYETRVVVASGLQCTIIFIFFLLHFTNLIFIMNLTNNYNLPRIKM